MSPDDFRFASSWLLTERKAVDAAWYAMVSFVDRGWSDAMHIRTWLNFETKQRGKILSKAMIVYEFRDGLLSPYRTLANVATLSNGLLLARVAGAGWHSRMPDGRRTDFSALVDTSESARAAWNLRWRKAAGLES